MLWFLHTVDVAAAPSRLFEVLEQVRWVPEWLPQCTGVAMPDAGQATIGTPVLLAHGRGRRRSQMEGRVTAYHADRHLAVGLADRLMEVSSDFVISPGPDGNSCTLTCTVDIRTKNLGRWLEPLISHVLPGTALDAMHRLKSLAETGSTTVAR